jgi:hypothetical protein
MEQRKATLVKRIISLLFVPMALLCLHLTFAQGAAPASSVNDAQVSLVMDQYFGALVNGDIATLKSVLGGDLLKKRSSLLDNPDYSGYLSATYMNATFKILSIETSKPDTVTVDALITLDQDESIRKQYVLIKSTTQDVVTTYHIVSEISPAGMF